MSICGKKVFSYFLYDFKTVYTYEHMEKADLSKYCLLLHRPGFPRLRHMKYNFLHKDSRNEVHLTVADSPLNIIFVQY